ncbi:MAG: hypothetical protein AAB685_00850 [Patescibacteria group bacterium]
MIERIVSSPRDLVINLIWTPWDEIMRLSETARSTYNCYWSEKVKPSLLKGEVVIIDIREYYGTDPLIIANIFCEFGFRDGVNIETSVKTQLNKDSLSLYEFSTTYLRRV